MKIGNSSFGSQMPEHEKLKMRREQLRLTPQQVVSIASILIWQYQCFES